jgi:hypothetical protein
MNYDFTTVATALASAGIGGFLLKCWQMYREGVRIRIRSRSTGRYDWFARYDDEFGHPLGEEVDFEGTIILEVDNFGNVPFTVRRAYFIPYGLWASLAVSNSRWRSLPSKLFPLKVDKHHSETVHLTCSEAEYKLILDGSAVLAVEYSHGYRMKRTAIASGPKLDDIAAMFQP